MPSWIQQKEGDLLGSTNEKQGQVNGAVSRSSMAGEVWRSHDPWCHNSRQTKPPATFIGAAPDVNKEAPEMPSLVPMETKEMPALVPMETKEKHQPGIKPNQGELQGTAKNDDQAKQKKDDKGAREGSRSLTPGPGEWDKKKDKKNPKKDKKDKNNTKKAAKKDQKNAKEGCQAKKAKNEDSESELKISQPEASSMVMPSDAKMKNSPDVRPSDGIADNHSAVMMQLETDAKNAKLALDSCELLIEVQHWEDQKKLRSLKIENDKIISRMAHLEAGKKQCQKNLETAQKAIAKQKDLAKQKPEPAQGKHYSYTYSYSDEEGGPEPVRHDPYL